VGGEREGSNNVGDETREMTGDFAALPFFLRNMLEEEEEEDEEEEEEEAVERNA
jgi:hypothetical protein